MSWMKIAFWSFVFVMTCSMTMGQEKKIEVGVNYGYTFSEGVDVNQDYASKVVKKINPINSQSWGLNADYLAAENFAVGFLFDQQRTKLNAEFQGGGQANVANLNTYNYHGVFTFNMREEDSQIRPYFFGGLGATHFGGGKFLVENHTGNMGSDTRFSTTWGGGVKIYPAKSVGVKLDVRWTPTYIKTDSAGIWCGWYGCWLMGDTDFSNQLKMSAGVVLRF